MSGLMINIVLGFLVLFIIGVQFFLVYRAKHGMTPHDIKTQRHYDAFISYKSEDAPIARACAEILMAKGAYIWFDEYVILLAETDQFEDEMKAGVQKSRYGICFTSEAYFSSPWCQKELAWLLEKNTFSPDRVLNARISEYSIGIVPDRMTAGPSISCTSVDVLMTFISTRTRLSYSLPLQESQSSPMSQLWLTHPSCVNSWRVDTSGWARMDRNTENAPQHIIGDFGVGFDLQRLQVGKVLCCSVRLKPTHMHGGEDFCDTDKLKSLRSIKAEAQSSFGGTYLLECLGVHLVEVLGAKHAAFTLFAGASASPGWYRIYRVFTTCGNDAKKWSIEFEFYFPGTFRQFCGVTYFMDRIVTSLSPVTN